jgi:hypothetical protein
LQTASTDGSKVFFINGALYEYEVETGRTNDLTVPGNTAENPGVLRVLGSSEDGSYVYFDATGVLAGGGVAGDSNLYVSHENGTKWTTTLIASNFEGTPAGLKFEFEGGYRVSPDGGFVAFMSSQSLTGYDNRDANSGQPDSEVYLYGADSKQLACASCHPTGARPAGASSIPTPPLSVGPGVYEGSLVPGRYVSNNGRLFFNSSDALVPLDVNGAEDVYEYEPQGVGDCSVAAGCMGLISAGSSPDPSSFLEASANGDDVFFTTTSQLGGQDIDNAFDVYDAHACTASAPCATQPVTPPPCTTGDSCKTAASPQPALFGAPPSTTISGAGNLTPSVRSTVTPKSLTRAQKLAKALKACRQKPKRKRAVCESQVRKQYKVTKSRVKKTSLSARTRG